jgi:predicted Zn-dependent protease
LNGKPLDEQRFYYLSQAYLDQPVERGDNLEKVSDEIPVSTSDKSKLESSQIFQPLPQKKKLFCLQTYVQWKSNLDLEFLKQFFTSPKRTIYMVQINKFPEFVNNFRININSQSCSLFTFIQEFLKIFYMGMDVQWLPNIHLGNTDWNIRERCNLLTEQLQYLVTDFFKPLGNMKPSDGYCIMGMTWTDLYPAEQYNFALGEAAYQYSSGVFSFGRLSPSTIDKKNPTDIDEITSEILWKLIKVRPSLVVFCAICNLLPQHNQLKQYKQFL